MDDPKLYYQSSLMTKLDADEVLSEFASKMHWKKNSERVIDVACADGGITANTYRKYLPENFAKIIGCDINEKMVKYANEHNRRDKVNFVVLDIEKELPNEHKGCYDHVFSFYILHWVKKQKFVFQNFYNLLDQDGECLVTGLAQMPFFEGYRAIARTEKWNTYLRNVEDFVSQYHDCADPETEVSKLMKEVGFKNIEVICKNREFIFETAQDLEDLLRAVYAFDIPTEKLDGYFKDLVQIILNNKIMDLVKNKNGEASSIRMKYKLIVAFGRK